LHPGTVYWVDRTFNPSLNCILLFIPVGQRDPHLPGRPAEDQPVRQTQQSPGGPQGRDQGQEERDADHRGRRHRPHDARGRRRKGEKGGTRVGTKSVLDGPT
jgi:hypothetical protein